MPNSAQRAAAGVHYSARRVLGGHIIGTALPLCDLRNDQLPAEARTGHLSLVNCPACMQLVKRGRAFAVDGKPDTFAAAANAEHRDGRRAQ